MTLEYLERFAQVVVGRREVTRDEFEKTASGQRQRTGALGHRTRARERVVEPPRAFGGGAGGPVGPARAPGDHQRGLGVVVGDGPVEGGAQVVVFLAHGAQPRALGRARERILALRTQPGEVRGHGIACCAWRRRAR